MHRVLLASLGAAFIGCTTVPALAIQTDNKGMHAAPVPARVAIDGSLEDWDLSGQVLMCYDLESLRDVYSAQVAAMYDAQNLYISVHWKDPVPMGNSHDPLYQADKGWAGDCLQLRLKTDRISHITAWYYAAKNEPAMHIDYGQGLEKPFGGGNVKLARTDGWKLQQGAEMAFQKDADGKGYVQEIKIPWSLITTGKNFKPGDSLNCGVELLWGETDWPVHRYADNLAEGTTSREFFYTGISSWGQLKLEPKGKLKLPEPAYLVAYRQAQLGEASQGPVEIRYDLPKNARVTLAIEDQSGRRVRNLIAALPREKGRNTEKWDGLDDNGKPVPPGDYAFKALYHDGIHVKYALSFASPGNPTWETSDGRGAFYGDHTAPQAAAAAGNFVALASPMAEAGKHVIGVSLDGQRLWGLRNRVAFDGSLVTLATDGKILWVGCEGKEGSTIYRANMATGQYAPWNKLAKNAEGTEFKVLDLRVSAPAAPGTGGGNLSAIALHSGRLAVSLKRENLVKILDAETGAVSSEIKVEAPQSVTFVPDGNLVVLTQGKLLRITPDGAQSSFTATAYPDGYGLASDAAGQIYLTVRGSDQNVKVFSPQGQLIKEIGARGGRPLHGVFNPNALRAPGQPAVDSKGRLWIPEETMNPKRTSVWDTATGQLVKDFSGTTTYAGAGAINPFDSTMGFADDTVYRLDWEKGTYAPVYSVAKTANANDLFTPSVHSLTSRIVRRGEWTYSYTGGAARGAYEVHCTLWDGKNWRSAAHLGVVNTGDKKGEYAKYQHPLFAGHENEFYAWADKSGDGLVQAEELTFTKLQVEGKPVEVTNFYWGRLPDPEGTVAYMLKGQPTLLKFAISGTTPSGAPIYDVTKPEVVKMDRNILGGNGEGMIIGGTNGRVYLNQHPLLTVEKDGRVHGEYPNKFTSVHGSHGAGSAKPGYLIGPSSFLGTADFGGEIGEIYDLNGNLGENYLFTSDGLWVQSLFKDTRGYFETPTQALRGMPMDATTAGGESFGGNFVRTTDGKVYLTIGGTDARVMEVTGLNTIRRFNGKFTYNAAQYAAAQRLVQEKAAQVNQPKLYTVSRQMVAPKIDGQATEWPDLLDESKPLLEVQESARQRYARVQARYDNTNLYLAYRVFAPRGSMKNAGQDERLLFKTGDAVDLMIGPEKSDSGAGNLRVLMSSPGGNPVAVVNQKVAPGAPATEKYNFSSPWRTIAFDRVATVNSINLATGSIQGGYFVEAAIPWSTLGLKPQAGLRLKADVGALFADNGGTTTVSRQYWSNKATGLVNDVPGEADLTPKLWGTFVLE